MKLNIGGRDIEIYPEPTVRTVEMVIAYDEKLTQERLKQYIPDLSELPEEDKKKEINQLIQERIQKDPDMMTSFAARLEHIMKRRATEEQIKTIMLVTGMTPVEIMDIPLKTLYTKCHEVLGGTAGDFFRRIADEFGFKADPYREKIMRAKHFIPRTSEDLQIDAQRAAKGERYKDREIALISSMRAHTMTWQALMDLPYRILLKMNIVKNAEGERNGH